ncbi:MAG: hypothetical protein GY711_14940 [bacterium]|nr:hypothetical protein [bacterium]
MSSTVLKRSPKRTVTLESDTAGKRVVKRFHAPTRAGRLFDGERARREHRSLLQVRAAGLRAPAPLDLRKREGRWELVTEWIDGTTLRARMHSGGPWPAALMRRLGTELASWFQRGVDHADLHPGNVLLDDDGAPWLIDTAHCRVTSTPAPERIRRTLIELAAGSREHVPLRARAGFLAAFRAALPLDADALAIEDAARIQRRESLRSRAARWMRESGAVTRADGGFLRRDLADAGERPETIVLDGDVRERWLTQARLAMHGIPCHKPVFLGADHALFEPHPAYSPGALLGSLHDRALDAEELGSLDVELRDFEPTLANRGAALGRFEVDATFLADYVRAQRHSWPERQALEQALERALERALRRELALG